ncbi:Tyrosine-protein phosphatase non-receptor type substrate 1 [Tupaia chinensis]|uniref:Tyrosine-protein phosphatase non-receptor type substrate 1 n=1 Tax=Tupaia chinensis TaxID=246437 RepID=L8Y2N2_TUPCH|nr:Tyrosine-protein phosphatase non-receptor type substrate 1 [Tupaia chinensis]
MMNSCFVFPPGAAGQELQVIQPDTAVSVWFKGERTDRQLIYKLRGGPFPRVTPVADITKRNNTDFSIRISDITPADAGTYYCVKYRRETSGDMEFKSGRGTELSVHGTESPTSILIALLLVPKVLLAVSVSAVHIHKKWKDRQ